MNTDTELEYNYGKEHCLMMIDEGINDEVDTIMLEPRCLYDDAVIGYTHEGSAVYGIGKMIGALVNDGSTESDALEHLDYNIFGALDHLPTIETSTEDGEERTVANPILVWQ